MKKLVFAFALLCSSSLLAQFSFNANGTGIESPYSTASGDFSTAMGASTTASGNYSTAMGSSSTASGGYSTAMGVATTASGPISTAMGDFSTASGEYSTAMGQETTASGGYSTAMGASTTASGGYSTAMGLQTTASGNYSTAMGQGTSAQDYGTIAIGIFNKTKEASNPNQYSLQNTAFVIGNGLSDNRSNAFEVLFDGSTTIAGNVTAPAFIGDGSQLTNLPTPTVDYGDVTNVPLIFYGNETGVQTPTSTASGEYSTAMGLLTTASGISSTALGVETNANGDYSTALGVTTKASGNASTAMGDFTTASGFSSTAMGWSTEASGSISTAMGNNTEAIGDYSTAMGERTEASGDKSTAMGYTNIASGIASTTMGGFTVASGNYTTAMGKGPIASGGISTAMGNYTTAQDYLSFAIGSFNKTDETPNPSEFSLLNTAFVIGNGTDDDNRSNAVEVLFDGTTTIAGDLNINSDNKVFFGDLSFIEGATSGTVLVLNANNNILFRPGGSTTVNFEPNGNATIAGDLNINSDARLKANIISLGATLSKLLQIDGKTYTMKKDANHKKKIGLLAQDIEKVFPELVTENNDIKSVNYQGLVPVLINAMKEQDEVIRSQNKQLSNQDAINKKQQQEIDTYKKELDELKTMVKQLISK